MVNTTSIPHLLVSKREMECGKYAPLCLEELHQACVEWNIKDKNRGQKEWFGKWKNSVTSSRALLNSQKLVLLVHDISIIIINAL